MSEDGEHEIRTVTGYGRFVRKDYGSIYEGEFKDNQAYGFTRILTAGGNLYIMW